MAQVALYGLDIVPRPDGVYSKGMPKIVKSESLQPNGVPDAGKLMLRRLLEYRPTVLAGEDQAARISPKRPRF